ncbi:polyribonucleotide nucleotidyltransferase [Treponema pallidum]|uniref:polyribonucleotide nucleotidyltransferase n=1 Tax=Treponema pallidum TaxID=160 RepID=UPI0010CA2C8C|nr:polyribonucleotide nucleotidyltransferase [Treponema pallidum]QCP96153.1 polyribonucleotide nucleotidyltransferase [Treponema pallidum subsp. pallidum]
MKHSITGTIGDHPLLLESGYLARQANGSVYLQCEGTAILATVCSSAQRQEGLDYVPLTVDFNEKYYAVGKMPGGFIKREGRPKDREILISRLIDRPMRPLFEKEFGRDIHVVPTCISSDMVHPHDVLAIVASSAAVTLSDIPFHGPVAAVRVAYLNGSYVINPTFSQIDAASMEVVVAGTRQGITMVEGGAREVSEDLMLGALEQAQEHIKALCDMQERLRGLCGKEKQTVIPSSAQLVGRDRIYELAYPRLAQALYAQGKGERRSACDAVKRDVAQQYAAQLENDVQRRLFDALFHEMEYEILRLNILDRGLRIDGRAIDAIRPIACEVGVLPRPHGSAVFTRGETQSLAVVTLGAMSDGQVYDDIEGDRRENFILHYNFPPFSVGEIGRMGVGRREIGHGCLAHRSLSAVIPDPEQFPYTVRVVSEILESNGSSSMATVCSGTLSLLHAGVPIKKPVAGIAMGLITDGVRYAILSDILGEEDHLGDMDFKVAGTCDGITGFQMDVKVEAVSASLMKEALQQARVGRLHILSVMNQTISAPSVHISHYAPHIESFKIAVEKIGALIGPGGKTVKSLSDQYRVTINTDSDGTVTVSGRDAQSVFDAKVAVVGLTEDPRVGRVYQGVVKRIVEFGAFVEIFPGKEGLCHVSKLSRSRVSKVSDVLQEGQRICVKLIDIDRMGRLNLSYIDALEGKSGGLDTTK